MADRKDSDREVLTSLPRTRPVRRSAKRGARPNAARAAAPKPAQTAAGGAKARKPRATAKPKATAQAARPAASAGARASAQGARSAPRRKVPPAGYESASRADGDQHPDLLGTAVQAAGELAQIGFAVGRQALQSILERLPKP